SAALFTGFRRGLEQLGIEYTVNPRLVRGLDYYTRTVFEWLTDDLGAQDAVCSGGRYDGLVRQLGGEDTPATGFAMGVERLIALMEAQQVPLDELAPHVYFVHVGETAKNKVFEMAERLRGELPWLRLRTHVGAGGFGSQFKKPDKSGACLALILGEAEVAARTLQLKPLHGAGGQEKGALEDVSARIAELVARPAAE